MSLGKVCLTMAHSPRWTLDRGSWSIRAQSPPSRYQAGFLAIRISGQVLSFISSSQNQRNPRLTEQLIRGGISWQLSYLRDKTHDFKRQKTIHQMSKRRTNSTETGWWGCVKLKIKTGKEKTKEGIKERITTPRNITSTPPCPNEWPSLNLISQWMVTKFKKRKKGQGRTKGEGGVYIGH
jgi:hypothetical protein